MTLSQKDMAELERSNAIFVLLAIEKNPGITKKGIITMDGENARTKFQRINELIDLGLVTYEDGPRYNSKLLRLTPEGQDVANKLKKIRYTILKLKRRNAEEAQIDQDDVSDDEGEDESEDP